tara:strand:- start:330 stop:1718 length:1389 start_codon:yes stop_codon:yes gene_type:complete
MKMGPLEDFAFDSVLDKFDRIGIAYSGGLDSTVLLHLLTQKKEFKDKIDAIHVNHSISRDSNKWEEFCRENAKQLDVDFFSYKVDGKNLSEADLRILRYQKFKEEWARYLNNNILLTAHHADDQAETIFFRFMRGTGLNGLKGIPAWGYTGRSDDDYKVKLHRPLLNVHKKEIYEYARNNKLKWVEDESNKDINISRNFIRNKLLPIIKEEWPYVEKSILHLSSDAIRSNKILQSVAREDMEKIRCDKGSELKYFNLRKFRALSAERAQNLLYYIINVECGLVGNSSYLKEVYRTLIHSNNLDKIDFPFRLKDDLSLMRLKVRTGPDLTDGDIFFINDTAGILDYFYDLTWDLNSKVEIPTGFLDVEKVKGEGIDKIYLDQQIYIKGRVGGERCKPFGRHKSQKLKKLFQEYEIPVWQRNRLPLIYIGEKLAAVGDLWVCDEFHTKPNKQGISINWTDNLTI